ncbi:pyridoxal phosphate-dependent aminotransferase [Bacillus sp. CLL-7-23]|uniref:cysteine-S-conjugate beta-lyase n=1 Tax=Bacillus changyiensis TaxID=3004103 RepID=A0ABT4X5T3_9BACI|nr:MalY/PatB family protein [Bacillus changyiensis]MDA7027628.1 pyridoxal phosphate-dependent aminotransferase [Bacillus changyiensis]
MTFNFDKMTDRFNTNSYKWSVEYEELPMWVADMDFEISPAIVNAMQKRLDHHIFGYTTVPDAYYHAVAQWFEKRHQFHVEKDWMMFCTGVVPAISSIVRKITNIGDNVLVLSPIYNIFYNSIINNHRKVLTSELIYKEKQYSIDFDDLERKLADPDTTLIIFCNPHNPIGKIWDRKTLEKIGNLCIKHNVLILSDEIHCDLSHPGYRYIPFASVSEEIAKICMTCVAPTKTFNLAGIQTSSIIVPNPALRKLVNRGINTDEVAEPNVFAIEAAISAFTEGEPWLEALLDYLIENKQLIEHFITSQLPQLQVIHSEATYLAWLDCRAITNDTKYLCELIRKETGLYVSEGAIFGGNGHQFIRLNYACPKARLEDGLQRLKKGIEAFQLLSNQGNDHINN